MALPLAMYLHPGGYPCHRPSHVSAPATCELVPSNYSHMDILFNKIVIKLSIQPATSNIDLKDCHYAYAKLDCSGHSSDSHSPYGVSPGPAARSGYRNLP